MYGVNKILLLLVNIECSINKLRVYNLQYLIPDHEGSSRLTVFYGCNSRTQSELKVFLFKVPGTLFKLIPPLQISIPIIYAY